LKVVLAICFVTALLLATTPSLVMEAEARSADEPCSYLHPEKYHRDPDTGLCHKNGSHSSTSIKPVQNYAVSSPTNTPQQINCGEGTILKGNLCVIDFRYEIVQGQIGGTSAVLLPVTNLFDHVPSFPEFSDPVLIGFFILIFIGSIFIGRGFSRKKRITRRNRRFIKQSGSLIPSSGIGLISQWFGLRVRGFPLFRDRYEQWSSNVQDEPGRLRVTPEEYRRMQAFERSFATVGKSDPEYFLHVTSGAKLIDASRRGNELYSINTVIRGRSLRLLKYRDTSTKVQDPLTGEWIGQPYVCFVEERFNNADHAMAWKFHLTPSEYRRTKGNEA